MGSNSIILICTLLFVHGTLCQLTKITLGGVIRDQAPNTMKISSIGCSNGWLPNSANNSNGFFGTDFQLPSSAYEDDEYGLCGKECNAQNGFTSCGMLGSDQTPVYILPGKSPKGNIQSPASFRHWFHTTEQNIPVNINVTLTQVTNGNVYKYSNDYFFPIDGLGWGDHCTVDGNYRNFAFCMEAHTRFGYGGGEVFTFFGDDDLWVYINNYLVIDLGSLHPKRQKSVSLDTLPFLSRGSNYRLDFFYCERHTSFSRLELTTSLSFYCTYEDWCGICEGTGQSCCTPAIINQYCNDSNDCTIDTCSVQIHPSKPGGCVHTPIPCTAPNACKVANCAARGGCSITNKTCDDNNQCTIDSCDPVAGCQYQQRVCNDNDACTVDTCNRTRGCVFTPRNCNDSNACTTDSCNSVTGCKNDPIPPCNDNSLCTTDTCVPSIGCVFTNQCNDSNPCTIDSCVPSVGCIRTPAPCGTGQKCMNDSCNPQNGMCVSTPITCPDRDACSITQCFNSSGCSYTTKNCNLGDQCKIYSCDPSRGCQEAPKVCNDNNNCTQDLCNPASGCYFPPVVLDDGAACTNDTCDPAIGIIRTTITCDDRNNCTVDSCRNSTGCLFLPKNCDFGDPCVNYGCDPTLGCTSSRIPGCSTCTLGGSPIDCITTDRCFPKMCAAANMGCANTTVNCNDNNACTFDICTNGTCSNPDRPCNPTDACDIATCDRTAGCQHAPKNCDDRNPCTSDVCTGGNCVNTLINTYCVICGNNACPYSDPCNPFICNTTTLTCQSAPVNCDDKNYCTTDTCAVVSGNATCNHALVTCPSTGDACRPNVCNPNVGCQVQPVQCADTDKCTLDKCVDVGGSAQCQFPVVVCNTTDLCNPLVCSAQDGQCYPNPVSCDDLNPCTNDTCSVSSNNTAVCSNTIFTCPGSDTCGPFVCDKDKTSGACASAFNTLVCNDFSPCTDDVGYCADGATHCNFTLNSFCDDKDACTNDVCDAANSTAPCSYTNVTCTPASVCEVLVECEKKVGCVFAPLACTEGDGICKISSCDPRAGGCILENRVCTVADPECFEPTCDPTEKEEPCQQKRLDWSIKIQCALKYDSTARAAAIGTGAAIGIALGGAAVLGVAGYGGKKGYKLLKMMREQRFGGVQNNPLYEATQGQSDNPLYRYSTGSPPPS